MSYIYIYTSMGQTITSSRTISTRVVSRKIQVFDPQCHEPVRFAYEYVAVPPLG